MEEELKSALKLITARYPLIKRTVFVQKIKSGESLLINSASFFLYLSDLIYF
ncbi:hypothetical protein SAMN04488522_107112 [Pedobacter caeni]|uniref:Uncharacterized protein n=1 Tax=Pedobacter caeni TaxID=288992 RepID=A0A1M5M9J5_9SPHI|nr:hypothetical protein SAMN04488522_107112 [Pedobacter caeni]